MRISLYMKASAGKGTLAVRELVLLAVLSALTFAMKVVMAGLPNIEPVSLMVMLLMAVFGWKGLWAVYAYIGLEFMVYGIGIWNLYYLYVWVVLAVAAFFLRKMQSPFGWALLSGGFGLLFGALCGITDIFIGGFGFAAGKWMSGIPFDITHCIGNFVIALLLFAPLRKLMEKLYRS